MSNVITKKRNTNVELLRLFSLFSIVIAHTISSGSGLQGVNLYLGVLSNTVFNAGTGVIVFMLITGYYGANFTQKRFNHSYSIIYICSLFLLGINLIFKSPGVKDILFAFAPVTTNMLWYATCYIYTLLLSPFLDKVIEKADKKTYQLFIGVSVFLFFVIPTFLYFDITGDRGKGIVYMLLAYFIGAYLRKYEIDIDSKKLWGMLLGTMAFSFIGNIAATVLRHGKISYPFSRECTVTVLIIAVCMLLLSNKKVTYNKQINFISRYIFYVFLLSPQDLVRMIFDVNTMQKSPLYPLLVIGGSILAIIFGFAAALILQYPAKLISLILERAENTAISFFKKTLQRVKAE